MTVWRFVRYWLYIGHRWLGIGACLLFAMWFGSGLVMSYVGYPEAQPARRYQALQPIDWSRARLDPNGLMSYLGLQRFPRELRLEMLLGAPVYRVIDWNGARTSVCAYSGERVASIQPEQALAVAEAYATARGKFHATVERDQWTVPERFNSLRPLHRFAMDDATATQVYVSAKTGEVALATTRSQRFWNWLGAVPHWIYFTSLRANQPVWRQVILWTSGPAILVAVTGIWIGILRLRATYRGWKNWHHWSGIVGGVFLLTWIVSGWLSVNPNGWLSGGSLDADAQLRYAGHDGAQIEADVARFADQSARSVLFFHIDGIPVAALMSTDGTERLLDARTGEPATLDDQRLIDAARRLIPGQQLISQQRIEKYDSYWYAHHTSPPLPVLRVAFDDSQRTWIYIDPANGQLLALLDDRGRRWRWWFSALHQLDFNWLVSNRLAWHAVVWTLSLAGFLISTSGIVIGWRRLRRKFQAAA